MTRLDQLRRMLADHRAGLAVDADADPWELVDELLAIADEQLERLRLVPGDMWSLFAEAAEANETWRVAQDTCHAVPDPTP